MKKNKHKHNWQMLGYGNRPAYVGTIEDMVVFIVCRDCAKVLEQKLGPQG